MKNFTFFKQVIAVLLLLISLQSISQTFVSSHSYFNPAVKDDVSLIGNNINGSINNPFKNVGTCNTDFNISYVYNVGHLSLKDCFSKKVISVKLSEVNFFFDTNTSKHNKHSENMIIYRT
ncbi:hypothetical protein QLS71_004020 [Mariniflexile litorale]|uniref:Uncharacterized protein n=1 Tax=Mariniflexile litorale TaxID=3045158 RepID=A0AAU7EIP4_9FLAO|nr:hypothetical protein [Mariniflexile sp. KMM 9835]MDQ8210187.1 hypothetical protein [Mariniflexile sp. KMM 9835]